MNGKMNGTIGAAGLATLVLAIALLSQSSHAALTFQGRACSDNSICDVIRSCDASGCVSRFENCEACGSGVKSCPQGQIPVPRNCADSGSGPKCVDAQTTCPSGPPAGVNPGEAFTTLTFRVFTKKNLAVSVTPESQTALAGKTLNYKISVENKNPKQLTFQTSSDIPPGWKISLPPTASVAANSKADIAFSVTSSPTASDAGYPILVGMFNSELNLFGSVTAQFIVASRGAPTISVTPKSQSGFPGQSVSYEISVTNNDPADFDASSASARAIAPGGFNVAFTPTSVQLKPQETGTIRMDVTSPSNETEASFGITVNVTMNRLAATGFAEYRIDFCGNGVCEQNEEGSCAKDCGGDPVFSCSGRCERELDDGLAFSAQVNTPFNRFIVCSRNASLQACVQAAGSAATSSGFAGINFTSNATSNCGIGKACLCAGPHEAGSVSQLQSNCNALCVDTKGVYYLAASTGSSSVRGAINWSYACPFVDLPQIKSMREDFAKARNEYEKARSALAEALKINATAQKRAEGQPCVDALSTIISDTNDFVKHLDAVITWPGRTNTTAARARAEDVRRSIEVTYNTYCRGASGLLQVEGIAVSSAEKGSVENIDVQVRNIGSTPYYGYVQCELTGAAGEKQQANDSCVPFGGQTGATSRIEFNASSAGRWTARCRALGSLISNCTLAALHSELAGSFNVSTRETFVVDVSGSCERQSATASGNLTCTVRGSTPDCAGCKANNANCILISSANGTSVFSCPLAGHGNYTLIGYSLSNERCKPVAPSEKNVTVRCSGCGDGILDANEQCENPYTNNNARCGQQQTTCNGKLFGIRDSFGFCNTDCRCSPDQYTFSCARGQCGAECADGETRTVSINKTSGTCSCTQQCGSGCSWTQCDCEPGTTALTTATAPPTINISHSLGAGGSATLTAVAGNAVAIEIYVDGFVVRSCQNSPCIITATFEPGTHSYFGRATNNIASVTDPTSGAKSFTIPGTNATAANRTTITDDGISLTLSHSPQNPTTADSVAITASASSNTDRIEIFADGTLQTTCSEFVCTLTARYSAGNHTYFAVASSGQNSVTNPPSGTRTFAVTQGAGQANGTAGLATATVMLNVNHNPTSADTDDIVTITAIGHGPRTFREVNIFADDTLKKTCTNLPPSAPCTFRSTFAEGSHSYFAAAMDVTNSSVRDPASGTKSFSISKPEPVQSNETGPGPSIGSGVSAGTTATAQARCSAKITDRNCTFNANTRRYDVRLSAIWDNGTHAHWSIDGDEGPKMYQRNFTHVKPLSGPGAKALRLEVHNVNDSLLCSDASEIYCGPGSTAGKELDLIIDVAGARGDVVKTGTYDVRIIATGYTDINALRLSALTESTLQVSSPRVEGNTSIAAVSGPVAVTEDKQFNAYTATTNLGQGRNISLAFKVRIDRPGEYKFIAVANYSAVQRTTKTIKVTSCPQAFKVLAAGPSGACLEFTTPCDVPAGWNTVEKCPDEIQQTQESGDLLPLIILILIVAIIAALAYKNRYTLRERLHRPKKTAEEMPRFDEEE